MWEKNYLALWDRKKIIATQLSEARKAFFIFFCYAEAYFSIIKTAIDTIFIFASIGSTASCHLDCF